MLTWCFHRLEPSLRSRHISIFGFAARATSALIVFSILTVFSGRSHADTTGSDNRIALLIANSGYSESNPSQQSATKDATLFADELGRDSFDVDLKKDLSLDGLRSAIDGFLAKIKPGSTALLYFNGIGIQVAHQTYLIPVNAEIWSEADVKRQGTSIDAVVAEMNRRGASVKIIVIDASRRNPFERRFRAYSAGLAGIDAPENTLVMYAAAPNKVGPDGTGDVSLFMNELVKEMRTPNISAEDAIMHTRVGVSRASNGEQVPWFASSLVDPIYFGRGPDASQVTSEPTSTPPSSQPADVTPKPAAQVAPPVKSPEPKAPIPEPVRKAAEPKPSQDKATASETTRPAAADPSTRAAPDQAGSVFRDCADCPEMAVLKAGSFSMGSGATPFDRPPHRVTIAKPFAMARAEVTFADWDHCMVAGGCTFKPDSQGFGEGDHPVMNVSWSDAKAFVAWLARKTGKPYRLPTEAEWEYAAHGGTTTAYSWGPTVGTHMANCADCGGQATQRTLPVRSFAANGFGLYDMAGNVAEWVEDCWNESYRGAPKDGSAWLTGTCDQRVLRGGSFDGAAAYVKPSSRFRYDADVRYWANGFRVMRELP